MNWHINQWEAKMASCPTSVFVSLLILIEQVNWYLGATTSVFQTHSNWSEIILEICQLSNYIEEVTFDSSDWFLTNKCILYLWNFCPVALFKPPFRLHECCTLIPWVVVCIVGIRCWSCSGGCSGCGCGCCGWCWCCCGVWGRFILWKMNCHLNIAKRILNIGLSKMVIFLKTSFQLK